MENKENYEFELVHKCAEKNDRNLKNLARELRVYKQATMDEISFHILNALIINITHHLHVVTKDDDNYRKGIEYCCKKIKNLGEKVLKANKGDKK